MIICSNSKMFKNREAKLNRNEEATTWSLQEFVITQRNLNINRSRMNNVKRYISHKLQQN